MPLVVSLNKTLESICQWSETAGRSSHRNVVDQMINWLAKLDALSLIRLWRNLFPNIHYVLTPAALFNSIPRRYVWPPDDSQLTAVIAPYYINYDNHHCSILWLYYANVTIRPELQVSTANHSAWIGWKLKWAINPCNPELNKSMLAFWHQLIFGKIKVHLHFISLLKNVLVQVLEILHCGGQRSANPAYSTQLLLMAWLRTDIGRPLPWYWTSSIEIFPVQHQNRKRTFTFTNDIFKWIPGKVFVFRFNFKKHYESTNINPA